MLGIGCDHRGHRLKARLGSWLAEPGVPIRDFGTFDEAPIDYPDIALAAAEAIRAGEVERAVLVCGTGLGMAAAANKVAGIIAVTANDLATARAARRSLDAQIIALGADIVSFEVATVIVETWLTERFQGGDSARKVAKIRACERQPDGEPLLPAVAG